MGWVHNNFGSKILDAKKFYQKNVLSKRLGKIKFLVQKHFGSKKFLVVTWLVMTWLVITWPVPTWPVLHWHVLTWPVQTWPVLTWHILIWPVLTYPLDTSRHYQDTQVDIMWYNDTMIKFFFWERSLGPPLPPKMCWHNSLMFTICLPVPPKKCADIIR